MHIFFLDLYTDIDTISPIIFKLSKSKKNKIIICSTNYIQNNLNNDLIKYFISKGINYFNFPKKNLKFLFIKFLIFLLSFFPKNFLNKFRFLFKYFYKNITIFSVEDIRYFLKYHNAKTVTIDTSNPKTKLKKIYEACKELDIKIIYIPSGTQILNFKGINKDKDLELCNFYLSQNKFEKFKLKKKNLSKIKNLGSPRYNNEWINFLNKFYKNIKNTNNSKLKIGIFVTPSTQNFSIYNSAISLLKNEKEISIKCRNKPRDYMPEKCCDYLNDDLNSTELIKWADAIISVQSSIIIECIKRDTKVLFLNYLMPSSHGNWIKKYRCVDLIESENELIDKIKKIKNNKYRFKSKNKKEYISQVVGEDEKKRNILDNYEKFYNSIV